MQVQVNEEIFDSEEFIAKTKQNNDKSMAIVKFLLRKAVFDLTSCNKLLASTEAERIKNVTSKSV